MEGSKALKDIKDKAKKEKTSLQALLAKWFKMMEENKGGLPRKEYKDKEF